MIFEVVRVKAEHVSRILDSDPSSQYLRPLLLSERGLKVLEANDKARTILAGGRPIMIGGVAPYWENRAEVWAIVDRTAGQHLLAVHRRVAQFLDSLEIRRLEAAVEVDFAPGHRWVKMLGFKLEAPRCEAYSIDGKDYALYSRVRRDH